MTLNRLDAWLQPNVNALHLRDQRQEVLASNIANADTPNYKARDFDFAAALSAAQRGPSTGRPLSLAQTDGRHLSGQGLGGDFLPGVLKYRADKQPSIDGNTVDVDTEMAAYSDNALRYQANLTFLSQQLTGLRNAIQGQ